MPVHDVRFQDVAKALADATYSVANTGTPEQTFRIAFQSSIADAARSLGIILTAVDEFRLIEGRADTVYNRVVIGIRTSRFSSSVE